MITNKDFVSRKVYGLIRMFVLDTASQSREQLRRQQCLVRLWR